MSDNCQICYGKRGGVLGNEVIIDNAVVCDYCHAILWETLYEMSEQARIHHLINVYGIEGARKKCVEYCKLYFDFAVFKLHRGKDGGPLMAMYYPVMRRSIDEFLEFICGN